MSITAAKWQFHRLNRNFYVSSLSKNNGCVITVMRSATDKKKKKIELFTILPSCSFWTPPCLFSLDIRLGARIDHAARRTSVLAARLASATLRCSKRAVGWCEKKKKKYLSTCTVATSLSAHSTRQGAGLPSARRWHCCLTYRWELWEQGYVMSEQRWRDVKMWRRWNKLPDSYWLQCHGGGR